MAYACPRFWTVEDSEAFRYSMEHPEGLNPELQEAILQSEEYQREIERERVGSIASEAVMNYMTSEKPEEGRREAVETTLKNERVQELLREEFARRGFENISRPGELPVLHSPGSQLTADEMRKEVYDNWQTCVKMDLARWGGRVAYVDIKKEVTVVDEVTGKERKGVLRGQYDERTKHIAIFQTSLGTRDKEALAKCPESERPAKEKELLRRQLIRTEHHEMAHPVCAKMIDPEDWDAWETIHKEEMGRGNFGDIADPEDPGKQDPEETFCEAMACFKMDPDTLKERNPRVYEYIQGIEISLDARDVVEQ